MNRYSSVVFAAAVLLLSSVPGFAFPQFLDLYRSDPFRNPSQDGCITCHMSAGGGDARNPFGQAFERAGMTITPMMRAQYPDRFVYPVSRVSDTLTIHFSDPGNRQVVIESGGTRSLVDVAQRSVDGRPATTPGTPTSPATPAGVASAPASQAQSSEVPVDEFAREGAFFGANVVNLPNGKPVQGGSVDFFIGHRFFQDIDAAGLGSLFGFDSSASVAYAFRFGLSDRVSVAAMRSNALGEKTISLSSSIQLSRQNGSNPLTLQARGGVDGKQNFGLYDKDNPRNPAERQYSPFIQLVGVHTIKDRVSLLISPTFAFNTRDDQRLEFTQTFGTEHNHTIALGIGAGVRVRPTVSLVGEYIPRLWGFRGEQKDYPGVSVGLQKSTFRHTFELVVSRQLIMTPAQVAFQGVDTFRIGFNIYRKLR
jgi:hypothetical protein